MYTSRSCPELELSAVFMSSVYERAFRSLRDNQPDAKEEAVMLLEAWRAFEADTFSTEQRQVNIVCPVPLWGCANWQVHVQLVQMVLQDRVIAFTWML